MICVVLLQNCVGFVEGETGYCGETFVMCSVGGTGEVSIDVEDPLDIKEEVSIKVEEAIDIKEEVIVKVEEPIYIKGETPHAISFPPIKTELEVRLWAVWERMCVCEVVCV
jgi:hypothetical protein